MDCNKDGAVRAMEIAQRKFMAQDFEGAKRFALKAQTLFPGLDGLSQFMEVIDIHIVAEKKINGEQDLYGILGVHPAANDEEIRKRYKKMALLLHPDKNKSTGADEAFIILSQAWSILSDKLERIEYDLKVNSTSSHHTPMPPERTQEPSTDYQYPPHPCPKTSTSTSHSNPQVPQSQGNQNTQATSSSHCSASDLFWTSCDQCMTEYRFIRLHFNMKLRCCKCWLPFIAWEIPAPTFDNCESSSQGSDQNQQQGHFGSCSDVPPVSTRDTHGKQADKDLKRKCEEPAAGTSPAPEMNTAPTEKVGTSVGSGTQRRGRPRKLGRFSVHDFGNVKEGSGPKRAAEGRIDTGETSTPASNKPKSKRAASNTEIRKMQTDKAKREILNKVASNC